MEKESDKYRAFIALDVPLQTKESLLKEVFSLQKQPALKTLRWIPESNWHLTLAFLGDQSKISLMALWEALATELQVEKAVSSKISAIAGFPDAKSSVLAAVTEPAQGLKDLQNRVKEIGESQGIFLDKKRFRPHITLARARKRQPVCYTGKVLDIAVQWCSLVLYTSELTPAGSVYTACRSLTLGRGND